MTKESSRKRKASEPDIPPFFDTPFGNVVYCLCRSGDVDRLRKHFDYTGSELLGTVKSGRTSFFQRTGDDGVLSILCIVQISGYDYPPHVVHGIIAHEALHIVLEMMQYIGEDNPSDEFFCYSLQEVVENLTEEYFK